MRQKLDTTFPTATAAVKLLEELRLLTELTGQKKNRLFNLRCLRRTAGRKRVGPLNEDQLEQECLSGLADVGYTRL